MSRESITRASFWRTLPAVGMQAQYPARVTYLEVGRFGELLITLEMSGQQMSLRLSEEDSAQVLGKLQQP